MKSPQLRSIGLLFAWVLLWGTGGSLIDAALIRAGLYDLKTGQLDTAFTFVVWTLAWAAVGYGLWRRFRSEAPDPVGKPTHGAGKVRCEPSTLHTRQ